MTKTKKYVRILKARYESSWYADKIGEVFELTGETVSFYDVRVPGVGRLVNVEDAELIVTEKRPAKRHDRILITNAAMHGLYKNGDEFVVDMEYTFGNGVSVYAEYDIHRLWGYYVTYSEYEVIVNNEVKNEEDNELGKTYAFKPNLDAMGYDELIEHGEAVMQAIRLRSYDEGYKQGKFDADMDATHSPEKEELPYEFSDEDIELAIKEDRRYLAQERRDEIVEQAKADVEELSNYDGIGRYVILEPLGTACDIEFIINRDKRTVVCLLKGVNSSKIYARGIAKAAPNDCFNVHIGEAIALHRALGLEVPDEYLNAPQPTEVRVGDVVECGHLKDVRHVKVVADGEYIGTGLDKAVISSITVKHRLIRIIDDSRTEDRK